MVGRGNLPAFDSRLPKSRAALTFARHKHARQQRPDGSPFIEHPLEVASLLYGEGAQDDLIAAGLLHDVLEKTSVAEPDLVERFGPEVAALVAEVSEDERIEGDADRKAELRRRIADAGDEALTLFAADKVSKVRELGFSGRPPRSRITHYRECLLLLEERMPDSPLVEQLRAELAKRERPGVGRLAPRTA